MVRSYNFLLLTHNLKIIIFFLFWAGLPLDLTGVTLHAINFTCDHNVGEHGCLKLVNSIGLFSNSRFSSNSPSDPSNYACGAILKLITKTATKGQIEPIVSIVNSTFEENSGLGLVCYASDSNNCLENFVSIKIQSSSISRNDLFNDALVYYDLPSTLPSCGNSIQIDATSMDSIVPAVGAALPRLRASYPYQLVLLDPDTLNIAYPPDGYGISALLNLAISDFWNSSIPTELIQSYAICFKANDKLILIPSESTLVSPSTLACSNTTGRISLKFELPAAVTAGDFQVQFGPSYCTGVPPTPALTSPYFTATIRVLDPVPSDIGGVPPAIIGVVVAVAFVLLTFIGFLLGVGLFRACNKEKFDYNSLDMYMPDDGQQLVPMEGDVSLPSLDFEQTNMDNVTYLLEQANLLVLDSNEIKVKGTIEKSSVLVGTKTNSLNSEREREFSVDRGKF